MPSLVQFELLLDPIKKDQFLKFNNLKLFEIIAHFRMKN